MEQVQQVDQITAGKVAKYMWLPGILPRLRRMAGLVAHFLHIFTVTFGTAGLIPRNHPCLLMQNIGKYRFRDIVGLAASNVEFSKKNIPQILMFFSVILGFLTSIIMVFLLLANISVGAATAHAQYFSNPIDERNDLAYEFLHNVFGQTGLENIWTGNDNTADSNSIMISVLKEMLATYSQAMLVIAGFIVIYLIVLTVAESAQTGQPFGQRFNTVWAPIRLAMAIGLLVPIGGGYNSAQLIVFQASHWGSALASNVWYNGLSTVTSDKFLAHMRPDNGYQITRGLFLISVCKNGWQYVTEEMADTTENIVPYIDDSSEKWTLMEWGVEDSDDNDFCGSVKVHTIDELYEQEFTNPVTTLTETYQLNEFPRHAQRQYRDYVGYALGLLNPLTTNLAQELADTKEQDVGEILDINTVHGPLLVNGAGSYFQRFGFNTTTRQFFDQSVNNVWQGHIDSMDEAASGIMAAGAGRGWAGAGSFYLTLTRLNNILSSAVDSKPLIVSLPAALSNPLANPYLGGAPDGNFWSDDNEEEDILESSALLHIILKKADEWFINSIAQTDLADPLDYGGDWKQDLQSAEQQANKGDNTDAEVGAAAQRESYSVFINFDNEDLDPLGRLNSIGNNLIGASVVMYGLGVLTTLEWQIGILGNIFSSFTSSVLGDIFFSLATILMLAGVTLVVAVPAFPFIYFTFAVIEWVASIFEAIIGMPLWALSFLTIDGDGLFGGKATQGAWLIFEIFLRPTIIVLTLVGTILIFSASVQFINTAYARFLDDRDYFGPIAWIGYIVLYVFIIYSAAQSLFKLIDELPNQFMRWAGESVQSFGGITKAGVADVNPYIVGKTVSDFGNKASGFAKEAKSMEEQRKAQEKQASDDQSRHDEMMTKRSLDQQKQQQTLDDINNKIP